MQAAIETPDTPDALRWQDGLRHGHDAMDAQHGALAGAIAALAAAPDAAVPGALAHLAGQLRAHFDAEDGWMAASSFPARDCHAAEHRAVRASLDGVERRVSGGDLAPARHLARALADWLPAHADYLDAPLAHWLCAQRHGARPVVLRRRAAPDPTPASRSPAC